VEKKVEMKKLSIKIEMPQFLLDVTDLLVDVMGDSRSEVLEFIVRDWILKNLHLIKDLGLQKGLVDIAVMQKMDVFKKKNLREI
jgi:metal-responsive CopG/Arc/MetJ family transcriptional regulator